MLGEIKTDQQAARFIHHFSNPKVENYSMALSDVLCWLDGFTAAGGAYSPQTQELLRDLNIALKQTFLEKSSSSQSHE